ncbi:hypothetical protein D3C73_1599570 [compost metagenome]
MQFITGLFNRILQLAVKLGGILFELGNLLLNITVGIADNGNLPLFFRKRAA